MRVAPALARRFTVVCPDLRGYGGSLKPEATPDHAPYAKRAMAQRLGRGDGSTSGTSDSWSAATTAARASRTGSRSITPSACEQLAVLDIVPTIEHFERTDMAFALGYYHWFWFAQPHPFPEVLINAAPEAWFTRTPRASRSRRASSTPMRWPTTWRRCAIPT